MLIKEATVYVTRTTKCLQTYIRETVEKQLKESLQKVNVSEEVAKYVKQSLRVLLLKWNSIQFINHGSLIGLICKCKYDYRKL